MKKKKQKVKAKKIIIKKTKQKIKKKTEKRKQNWEEPMSRSTQLHYIPVTAFS